MSNTHYDYPYATNYYPNVFTTFVYMELETDKYEPSEFPGEAVLCVYSPQSMRVLLHVPSGVTLQQVDSWGYENVVMRWLHYQTDVSPVTIDCMGQFSCIYKTRGEFGHLNPFLKAINQILHKKFETIMTAYTKVCNKSGDEKEISKDKGINQFSISLQQKQNGFVLEFQPNDANNKLSV